MTFRISYFLESAIMIWWYLPGMRFVTYSPMRHLFLGPFDPYLGYIPLGSIFQLIFNLVRCFAVAAASKYPSSRTGFAGFSRVWR